MIKYVQSHFDDGVTIVGKTILGSLIGDEARVFGEDCYRKRLSDNVPDKNDNFVTTEYKSLFTKILLITGILIDQAQIFKSLQQELAIMKENRQCKPCATNKTLCNPIIQ